MSLTEKQKQFCREHIKDYNGTQAAIRAGYRVSNAASQASKLLKKPEILQQIKEYQKQALDESCLTPEKIISELEDVLKRCKSAVPVLEWDYDSHQYVETGEYQFDSKGALKAIELLGKYLNMFDKSNSQQQIKDDGFIEALNQKAGEVKWEE